MTQSVRIESGVPIPPKRLQTGTRLTLPFAQLDVGQSFLVEELPEHIPLERIRISNLATYAKRVLGYKFSVRAVEDGVRVWRTE